jgi:hypothetical protein
LLTNNVASQLFTTARHNDASHGRDYALNGLETEGRSSTIGHQL